MYYTNSFMLHNFSSKGKGENGMVLVIGSGQTIAPKYLWGKDWLCAIWICSKHMKTRQSFDHTSQLPLFFLTTPQNPLFILKQEFPACFFVFWFTVGKLRFLKDQTTIPSICDFLRCNVSWAFWYVIHRDTPYVSNQRDSSSYRWILDRMLENVMSCWNGQWAASPMWSGWNLKPSWFHGCQNLTGWTSKTVSCAKIYPETWKRSLIQILSDSTCTIP